MLIQTFSLERLGVQYQELDAEQRSVFSSGNFNEFMALRGCESMQKGLLQFIDKFGHLSDSGNDFSYTPWRENQDMILKMVKSNAESSHKLSKKMRFEDIDPGLFSGIFLKVIYQKARQYFLFREQVGSLYTFGYGLFRDYFLALGQRFHARGLLNSKEDIFYLHFDEIRSAAAVTENVQPYILEVEKRRQEMEKYRSITPPVTIFGDQPLPIEENPGAKLVGTPTSSGYYEGPVTVVRGIDDFDKIRQGDVLVVPYSDVGWTPMYVKAGAVVAESGGMLSHSSIVAREYGIPAVVSVPGACKLLSGKVVTVDGYRGKVTIHET